MPLEVIPCSADLELFDAAAINEKEKTTCKKNWVSNKDDFMISLPGLYWWLVSCWRNDAVLQTA